MKFRKLQQNVLRIIGHLILFYIVNVLCKSLRITFQNKKVIDDLNSRNEKFILAFWHGTMLLPWYLHRKSDFASLISKSKDGDLLAKILKKWKYEVIRGSSS